MIISRPVGLFVAASVIGIGIYMYVSSQADSSGGAAMAAVKSKSAEKPSDYTDEDYSAHFDSPSKSDAVHNVFLPLVRNEGGVGLGSPDPLTALKDNMRVPANVAGGDANWIFTGYAVIDGVRSALLENRTTHKSDFVTEGSAWKASRLLHIDGGVIVFDDLAGGQVSVTRFDPVLAAKSNAKDAPGPDLKPFDPSAAMQGPIGPPPGPGGPGRMRGMNGVPNGVMMMNGGTVSVSIGG